MLYYLVLNEEVVENSKDLFVSQYKLVRTSFETAYALPGYKIFERLLDEEKIDSMEIIREDEEEYEIKEFIEELEDKNLRVRE